MTDTDDETDASDSRTRRNVLVGLAGLGAAGVFGAGRASAQASASGEVGTPSNPYLRAYIDTVNFTARTTDPSSPADGTLWYNQDA